MITVASFPGDLGTWDQDENPFYLEVFGEAEPLHMTHAEVIHVGGSGAASASRCSSCSAGGSPAAWR